MSFCDGENNEYYQLVNCSDGSVFKLNNKPARFDFLFLDEEDEGIIHPDDLLGKVISSFTTGTEIIYNGCWTFTESEEFPEYTTVLYTRYFTTNVVIECGCSDCLPEVIPEPPVINTVNIIYPETDTKGCDPNLVEQVMSFFTNDIYKSMMSKRLGVSYCCLGDLQQSTIDFQVLLLDMMEDKNLCNTEENCENITCNCYSIEITQPMLDNAINNSNVTLNNVVMLHLKYCGDLDYTIVNIGEVGVTTYCLACEPFIGYMNNNNWVQLTQNITFNGGCSENNPCV
jgi:hypothetical protein